MTALLVLTGASGAGKTTLVRELAGRGIPGLRTYHFDSIGVPTPEEMVAKYGSGESWQEAMTRRWIERLLANPDGASAMVLEGQMRPHLVRAAWGSAAMNRGVALVDCTAEDRRARLGGPRDQPELATARMDSWAAYLRGQADALGLPIIDTSRLTLQGAVDALADLLKESSR
jgi:hypothetical protein